jgi:ABC-type transport system involved in multi-copper enzyme maturation permease subunit
MRITQGVFVVTTIAWILLSFALNLDVVEGSIAALRIFGMQTSPLDVVRDPTTGEILRNPDTGRAVLQAMSLGKWVLEINQFVLGATYFFGTLLGLFATQPLVSGFVEHGRVDLMLSKPVRRSTLLAGHIAGVWSLVAALVMYLVGAVWIVISIKTGLWIGRFLLAIPIIVLMFAVMYSIVVAIGVGVRNTGLALVVAYGCLFFSAILSVKDQILPQIGAAAGAVFVGLYHLLPNYIEVISIIAQLASDEIVKDWYPLISSAIFGVVVYAVSFVIFSKKDY